MASDQANYKALSVFRRAEGAAIRAWRSYFVYDGSMSTPRISYAHMNATVNPKHVDSLVRFFESGAKSERNDGYGVEIEHLPVRNGTDQAVNYYEPNGIEVLLNRLRPYYDADKE